MICRVSGFNRTVLPYMGSAWISHVAIFSSARGWLSFPAWSVMILALDSLCGS